jgi:hypothetical protein
VLYLRYMQRVTYRIVIGVALTMSVTGAGCTRSVVQNVQSSFRTQEAEILPPKDAWGEFERASALPDSSTQERTYASMNGQKITLRIPTDWQGDGPVWHPGTSKLDQIRIAYFPSMGPETQWSKERGQVAETDVAHAAKRSTDYILMVNSGSLKATVFKIFTVDAEHPGEGFYLLECRVGYQSDRAVFWDACKAAVESARYY